MVLMAPLLYRWLQVLLSPVQTARMVWFVPFWSQSRMLHPAAVVKSEMEEVEPFCVHRGQYLSRRWTGTSGGGDVRGEEWLWG